MYNWFPLSLYHRQVSPNYSSPISPVAVLYLGIGTVTIEADNGEYSTVQPILEALLSFSE